MLRLLAVLLFAVSAWASQSLNIGGSVSGSAGFPDTAPFRRTDQLNASQTWEWRMHNFTVPSSNYQRVWTMSDMMWAAMMSDGKLTCINYLDSVSDNSSSVYVGDRSDIVARCVRDLTNNRYWIEVRNIDGTGHATGTVQTITTPGGMSGGRFGGLELQTSASFSGKLAWLRWRPSAAAQGSTMPRDFDSLTGVLGAWEFEGNGNDSGTHGNHFGAITGASYSTTNTYAQPACNAGTTQAIRAGQGLTLDGSGSMPLNDNPALYYTWQQVSGPSDLEWTSRSVSGPQLKGFVHGSYVFRLTVRDSSGGLRDCTIKHSAVTTDANGVVLIPNADHAKFFGAVDPGQLGGYGGLMRHGVAPWPYFDDGAKNLANMIVGKMETHFASVWDTPGPGTISLVNTCPGTDTSWYGSATCATVTGTGTQFQTDFCGGAGNTVPEITNNDLMITSIVVWYRSTLYPGTYGRRRYPVKSCDSQTQLTLGRISEPWSWATWSDHVDSNASGLQYSKYDQNIGQWWHFGASPANYYDNVVALYAQYYRTGNDDYLTAARTLADRWWTFPWIDKGAPARADAGSFTFLEQRSMSIAGLMLRAMDGRPEMWTGIRRFINHYSGHITSASMMSDQRNVAYQLIWTALDAMFDPDATQRNTSWGYLESARANKYAPYRQTPAAGQSYWNFSFTGGHSFTGVPTNNYMTGTVAVTNGSTTVTGTGTNFMDGYWPSDPPNQYRICGAGAYIWVAAAGATHFLTASGGNNGDAFSSKIASVSSNGQLTLTNPYAGATASGRQYVCGGGWFGAGVQPFMLGFNVQGFYLARQVALSRSETAAATAWETYARETAKWLREVSYDATTGGAWYGKVWPNCHTPYTADIQPHCPGVDGEPAQRINQIEQWNAAYNIAYLLDPTTELKNLIDARFGIIYGKPGSGSLIEDSRYVVSYNDPNDWLNPNSLYGPKWYGFSNGIGLNGAWLAERVGGLSAPILRTAKLAARIADHPLATKIRVTVRDAKGVAATPVVCTSSPCSVTVDARQGNHSYKLDLLNASDVAVVTGEYQPLVVVQ